MFRDAAKLYLREFDIMTQGQRNATYARGQHARTNGYLVPLFGSMVLPKSLRAKSMTMHLSTRRSISWQASST